MLERRTAWGRGSAGAFSFLVIALASLLGCSTEIEGPTPKIDSTLNPAVACNASNAENAGLRTAITITSPDGTFSPLPVSTLEKPSIELPRIYLVQNGKEIEIPDVKFKDTKTIEAVIDASPPLPAGEYQIKVVNANGRASNTTGSLRIVDPPVVTKVEAQSQIASGSGAQICTSIDNTLTLTGTGFRPSDPAPVVTVLDCTDPNDIKSCAEVRATLTDVKVTSETTVTGTLPGGMAGLPPGKYGIRVTNPEQPPCTGTLTTALVVVPSPTITSVAPPVLCGPDQTLTVTGSGYHDPMTAKVGDQPMTMVTTQGDTTLTGVAPNLPVGTYDVTVTIPEGCSATLPMGLKVASSNVTLSAILPKQGWNGIDNPVQIFGNGFSTGDALALKGAAQGGTDLGLTNVVADATGTHIDAIVPKGGVEGGPYDLVLTTATGCVVTLPQAFTILGQPSLTVDDIVPPYGWTGTNTPVSIRGTKFQSTPRAYLVIPAMSPSMVPLRSTAFVNDTSLTAVVPQGLPVGGPYDVVVINPDGGGGLEPAAFRVTQSPPPTIDNVTPAAGTTQGPTSITITGCNFRDPATVDLVTKAGDATAATVTAAPVCNGAPGCPDNTNHCTMTASVPSNTMTVQPYVVRVTDTDEMTYGQYSLFVVTQPSAKLDVWQQAPVKLVTGRRAHAGVAGRVDAASRFLYAIGGDTGAGGMSLDSIEVIPLDIFGTLGKPFQQQNKLGAARTGLAAVQTGGYVYVLGGSTDGAAPLDTIERAKILTDVDVPLVSDPTLDTGMLPAGTWYYRVSAVKDASDLDNPNGETLPSDEVVVQLALDNGSVTLSWKDITGAKAYRIYRTEKANGASSTEVFLAEVAAPTVTYTDDGKATPDTTRTPLLRGSTGVWVTQANKLVHARRDLAATIAHDPTGAAFLYAVGGRGDCTGGNSTAPMACYEFASLSPDGAQLKAWAAGSQTLKSVHANFGLSAGEHANASQIPTGQSWLFATGGAGATVELEATQVMAGGDLAAWTVLTPPGSSKPTMRNGHALQLINNAMYLIAGANGSTEAGPPLDSAQFSVDFDAQKGVPARNSFSNSSSTMTTPRWRQSLVLESGFFYAIGGSTDAGLTNAVDTIEQIIF